MVNLCGLMLNCRILENLMIRILTPSPAAFYIPWVLALTVTNVGIALNYYLSWAHMVMATISLTGGLLLWHLALVRCHREESEEASWLTNLPLLAVPFCFTGLLPWGARNWYNMTFFLVVTSGFIAMVIMFLMHRQSRPALKIRATALVIGIVVCGLVSPLVFVITAFTVPHHHSNSPPILLSGTSPDSRFRLTHVAGTAEGNPGGYLKLTLHLEERTSEGWRRLTRRTSGRPAHLSGSWIEGQKEKSLRARWIDVNEFEFSYLGYRAGGTGGRQMIRVHCIIVPPTQPPTDMTHVHCKREFSTPTTPLRMLLGWDKQQ